MQDTKKTIIAAPAGLQGVFEIGGKTGFELYLDAVVALAIITLDEEELLDGKNLATVPLGIGLDGSVALAVVAANGVVHNEGGSWPSLSSWFADQAGGRIFIKDQFDDEPATPAGGSPQNAGIFT